MRGLIGLAALGIAAIAIPQTGHATVACPTSDRAAMALFASPDAIGAADAIALAACSHPLARELGIAVLGDTDPALAIAAAVLNALDDPQPSVRFQAFVAILRNPGIYRAVLAEAREDNAPSRAFAEAGLSKGAIAAIALAMLDEDWWARPTDMREWADPTYETDKANLASGNLREREAAAARLCKGPFEALELDGAGLPECPGASDAERAVIAKLIADSAFRSQADLFEAVLQMAVKEQELELRRKAEVEARRRAEEHARAEMEAARAREAEMRGSADMKRAEAPPPAEPASEDRVGSGSGSDWDAPWSPATAGVSASTTATGSGGGSYPKTTPGTRRPRDGAARSTGAPPPPPKPEPTPLPAAVAAAERRLPHFPWPAPKPVKQLAIPLTGIGGPSATLDQVLSRLQRAIMRASPGYETGVFSGPPGGFVLLTRLERVQQDGRPFDETRRFTTRGNPKASFWDMLNSLMQEKPGHFRAIAFVVTDDLQIDAGTPVGAIPLERIGEATELPAAIGRQKLGGKRVYALVYAFERLGGRPRRPWISGAPSALQHLRASGIGSGLGL